MKRFLSLCVALLTAICLWAGNVITYKAVGKLVETTSKYSNGLHTNAFGNVSISSHTFSNGTGTITFNKDIAQIGDRAFYECKGLTSVTIPSSVLSIGEDAFYNCSGLTSVTIPSSVLSIGEDAFYRCSGLTSISIPSSVTSIGSYAFYNCSGLTSISIPSSVTSIGSYAFYNCSGLTKAEFASIESLCKISFENYRSNPLYEAEHLFINGKEVTSVTIPSSVTSIGTATFAGCSSLTSVTIHSAVTSIGASAFSGCYGLTKAEFASIESLCKISFGDYASNPLHKAKHLFINGKEVTSVTIPSSVTSIGTATFAGCSSLTSVTIHSAVTSIGASAFSGCSGLTSVAIPNSVTSIGASAFSGCSGLTSVAIPNSVTSIGSSAFYGCSGLKSMAIPNSVTSIGSSAFSDCSGLTSISIPSSITRIEDRVFENCGNLKSMTIPASITSIGRDAFFLCWCNPLYFKGIPTDVHKDAFGFFRGNVLAPSEFKSTAINSGLSSSSFFASEGNDWGDHVTAKHLEGFTCYEPFVESVLNFKNIKFYLEDGTPLSYTKTDDGYYTVKGLKMGTSYNVKVTYTDGEGASKGCWFTVETISPSPYPYYSSTQSTVTIEKLNGVSDATCTPEKVGILYNGVEYTNFPVVISDLYPGEAVSVQPFAYYNGVRYDGSYRTINAATITLYINERKSSYASTLSLNVSYTEGDAEITDEKMTINGKAYGGKTIIITGLDPNTKYTATYSLKANGHEFSQQASFTTPGLTMKTSQPKVINVGNVIVAAEANLDEEETNVGFEWRRTDWTSDFASNTGGAYMYNGQMEGYIRNLNAEKLWKYRPYYLSDSGKYYYGDWVGLDPSNTSYFEATVHTYDKIEVEGNTALVKGYALRGTDPIKVQGFVYWKKVAGAKAMDSRMYAAAVPSNAKTVEANGQIMSATLADLDYDSEYAYVAFVTTTEGETFYGEERTFKTEADTSGISDVMSDNASSEPVTVMGYYDLNGRRIQTPERGIYIIRYSDGSSRKFMKK